MKIFFLWKDVWKNVKDLDDKNVDVDFVVGDDLVGVVGGFVDDVVKKNKKVKLIFFWEFVLFYNVEVLECDDEEDEEEEEMNYIIC